MVKILLIGESGVGKTCVLQRFNNGEFMVNHLTTIAIDFKVKFFKVGETMLKMQIWDTAGQERFHTLTQGFFNCSHGIVVVYSVTDIKSFQKISHWISQIKQHAPEYTRVILIGNKCDLKDERVVSYEQGKEIADKNNVKFFETSAYNGENIEESFRALAEEILENNVGMEEGETLINKTG